ncbi:urease accessory protein UreD [Nitrosococcus oceani]|uniref:Urease accessory protein UreD n=2 Tax=Nitrosococcus oceani TaxID=1229 RepID=URED_NITOC|nr:urease accessory protein UreD [Nitrosococcus oceani]Q3J767.1 RecName: Full=Urease accessory protein UreD [Nitrosococcus oceani ATCC 19707]ABA59329.1 Urease accessory protein UreD [Nitrosococcus oceani ATCC 19707]EDZ66131.1 urease accessory protein UreD, putative [Nitrosococcus oceani AFC27]GEM20101.1 urease accessory protein UreD [Nitrosococcus oceani]
MKKIAVFKQMPCEAADAPPAKTDLLPLSWPAKLELGYQRVKMRTVPVLRRHQGPLRVQKHLYPEGPAVCQHMILHPPGGIAGGDTLDIQIHAGSHAWAQLTSPGAAKWYRSEVSLARQNLALSTEPGGILEWLPQETIFFAGCQTALDTTIDLAEDAKVIAWDIIALGRPASGERFNSGRIYQRFRLRRNGRLLWSERMQLLGGSRLLESPIGFAGYPVAGTLLASGELNDQQLTACRSLPIEGGRGGLSQLPGLVVARFLGEETEAARNWFIALWQELRPALLGRSVSIPRIWNT